MLLRGSKGNIGKKMVKQEKQIWRKKLLQENDNGKSKFNRI